MSRSSIGMSVEHVDHLGQQRRRRDGEARALHVLGVRRAVLRHVAQEREDMLGDDRRTSAAGAIVLEARPAQLLVGRGPWRSSLPSGKMRRSIGRPRRVRLVLLPGLDLVEAPHEEQVGDLLDHLERIGDAARPEGIPHLSILERSSPVSIHSTLRISQNRTLAVGGREASHPSVTRDPVLMERRTALSPRIFGPTILD